MRKYFAVGVCVLTLLLNADVQAQKSRPRLEGTAPSIKGWWRSMSDPRSTAQFDDTLTCWYYDYKEPTAIRYWLVADCKSTKAVSYGKAEYIVFKKPGAIDVDCAWFIASDNQYLGWIDNSTGRRQSFRRIKGPKIPVSPSR